MTETFDTTSDAGTDHGAGRYQAQLENALLAKAIAETGNADERQALLSAWLIGTFNATMLGITRIEGGYGMLAGCRMETASACSGSPPRASPVRWRRSISSRMVPGHRSSSPVCVTIFRLRWLPPNGRWVGSRREVDPAAVQPPGAVALSSDLLAGFQDLLALGMSLDQNIQTVLKIVRSQDGDNDLVGNAVKRREQACGNRLLPFRRGVPNLLIDKGGQRRRQLIVGRRPSRRRESREGTGEDQMAHFDIAPLQMFPDLQIDQTARHLNLG